jgi:hypothetical protein
MKREPFANTTRGPGLILKNGEKLLDPVVAIEKATGERKHKCIPRRYMFNGLGGLYLECVKSGGKLRTSAEAVARFYEACTLKAFASKPAIATTKSQSESTRRKAADRARKQLESAGI